MRVLRLTINNAEVARIAGEDLGPSSTTRKRWSRFSSIEIHEPATGTWLRFEAEPVAGDDAPPDLGSDKDDARRSTVVFNKDVTSDVTEDWRSVVLRFFWRNPLTPHSRGLWMRLNLERVGNTLRIAAGANETRVWSFRAREARWDSTALLPSLAQHWTPAEMLAQIDDRKYVDIDGSGCALLTRSEGPWLVDARDVGNLDDRFRLAFLTPRNADGVRLLASQFIARNVRSAVNAAALGVDTQAAISLDAASIHLTCARGVSGFLVEWLIESREDEDPETLSLNTLYNALARHYVLGMASARSRNRLTFAPTRLSAGVIRLHFAIDPSAIRLRRLLVDQGQRVRWTTGGASEIDGNPIELVFRQEAETPPLAETVVMGEPVSLLLLDGPKLQDPKGTWLVNGVQLALKVFQRATLDLRLAPGAARYGQAPASLDLRLEFTEGALEPASDDPEIGFEGLSAWLDRERPMVVDLRTAKPPKLRFSIHEFANETQSRILRIGVRNAETTPARYGVDAVVLDPSPLTAARVQSVTPVDPDGLVAEYTDDSDQAPEWAFASTEGTMTVVLPPQVIGEEMIKGRLYIHENDASTEVPPATEPFDFRLSPNARLTLDRTDIDTARTVAPWSLRRLLGQRPGVVGTRLQSARLELLYGLLTEVEDVPGLRIGELDALVGRIPFPDELLDVLREVRDNGANAKPLAKLRGSYAHAISRCIRGMLYRPGWWPVFRDFAARQQLTVTGKGVSGALRPTRATAHPFDIGRHAATPPAENPPRKPLRGGVDWPFQSRNVYDELTSKPHSSRMTLEGLAFGTLGGSGKQTAEFNDGKTIVISETTQGRLDAVTVIRIGRIAMLWNHARHVIVYERTTRRAPRYAIPDNEPPRDADTWDWQAPGFDGLAALRKVREYVEITEPKRAYPDTSTTRPIAGPLRASFFETTIIPVKSSWGRDVPTGFVIALRGPLKESEKKFFPFPKIFLKQARARGKGEGTVDCQLRDPAELLFYTSTRAQDGGDPDQWPPVPDVDFPLVRPPKTPEPLPFRSRFSRFRKQPDARIAEFGQRRFTVTLDPPEEAVDLMHGRLSEGIEARVSAVSLARGRLPDTAVAPGSLAEKAIAVMASAHAPLHDGLAELRMQIAQARTSGAAVLGDLGAFASEARALVRDLGNEAHRLADNVPAVPAFDWSAEQAAWNEGFKAKVGGSFDTWQRQLDLAGVAQGQLVPHARAALEQVCQQIHQRIDEAGSLPLAAMERIDQAEAALEKRASTLVAEVLGELHAAIDRVHARYDEIVAAAEDPEADVPALPALQEDVDAALAAFTASLARFDVDGLKHVADTLGEWFTGGGTGLVAQLETALGELVAEVRERAAAFADSVPPIDILEPDWQELKDQSSAIVREFFDALIGRKPDPQTPLDQWPLARRPMERLRRDLAPLLDARTGRLADVQEVHDTLERACKDASAALDEDVAKAIEKFLEDARTQLKGLGGVLANALGDLQATAWQNVAGSFDHLQTLQNHADAWLKEIDDAFADSGASLAEVEQAVEAAAKKIAGAVEGAARQVERAVVNDIRKLGIALDRTVAGLDLTRVLATGPVNDAIRCTRDQLGYFYDATKDLLDVTRASALFNELGASVLNALNVELPFDRIRDRLLPQLQNLDLGDLLPSFGGLRLDHLFPDLAAPDDGRENDWIRVRHGFDKDRLTAFADVAVDKILEGAPAVFILPPLALRIASPHFLASSRLELSQAGGKAQSTKASLFGDWMLCLSEKPIVTIREATLYYDSDGGFDFDFDSKKIVLSDELRFITDALKNLLPQEEGLTLTPIMPAGIRAELALPLPDIGTGAFTLTGITLFTYVELLVLDGFEVRTGFWLSKPNRPFGLAVLFLGGGGWVGLEASYRPTDRFVTRVSIGIAAGAFVAVNFGVARGSAGLLFTAGLDFYRDWQTQSGRTLITLGILVWGEFSILGIASASLRLMMSVTYDGSTGSMMGRGLVEVSIKICWCFTLRVRQEVRQQFAGRSRSENEAVLPAGDAPVRDRFTKAVRTVNSNVAL